MEKAIVLGGTSPHIDLINKLKARGYYVVLIDYLANSPASAYADEHIKDSTLDNEKVLQIAREINAKLVISTCIDQANSVCCYVAEKLDLPKPYTYQTSLNVTDKGLMKKIMAENDIPTSSFIVVKEEEEIDWNKISFPAVVKPVDCNSSKGVHRVDNREETIKYVKEALEFSRTHCAIIEGYNEGNEIQVDCFVNNTEAKVLLTRQKKKIAGTGNDMVLQSTGSIIPAELDKRLKEQAEKIANQIANAFKLRNTSFFYQAIVNNKGISVLEFAPRIGGGLSYYLLRDIAGFDSIEGAIDSFLGRDVTINLKEIEKCYSTNLIYMHPGVFQKLEGFDEAKEDGLLKEYFPLKKSGTKIDDDLRSGNRVAAFVVEADTYQELEQMEKQIYERIKILDNEGKDVLKREFL